MKVWEFIDSTTESVKRNTPDLTPINNACKTTLYYGSAAASTVGYYALTPIKTVCKTTLYYGFAATSTVDNAVRVNGFRKVNEYMLDEEARAQLSLFATKLTKHSAFYLFKEGYKLVPGGKAVAKIASSTLNEMKSENCKGEVEVKKINNTIGNQKLEYVHDQMKSENNKHVEVKGLKISNYRNLGSNDHQKINDITIENQKPEDVLRVFMMKEFMGIRFLDDLIVPGAKRS